jgi:hypothetical protein
MSGKVNRYNTSIFQQIEEIEKKEKDANQARNIAIMAAAKGDKKK